MKNYLILFYSSILISILLTNSANSANGLNLENKQENIVKFSEVEEVPLYPDCITLNFTKDKMRECTNEAIKMFASSSFNTELSNDLGLTGYQRITSSFIIDKKGQIVNIRVRAPHPQLKDEAIRVINLLPKMKPGKVNGKVVSVSYLLPIIFKANPIKTYNDSISNSDDDVPVLNVITGNKVEIPISVIENVPIFPGCDKGNNTERRMCMSRKIQKFVKKEFNTDLAGELLLSGTQRISVIFKIDKNGDVVDVRARAPHPRLVKEAIRVVNLLPKMKPGKQKGKAVVVTYSMPIQFFVQN
jgi:hypothetical protein